MSGALVYLIELRQRLLRMSFVLLLVFVLLSFYAKRLYFFLSEPLLRHISSGPALIATTVPATFLVPLKLAFYCALFFCMPYLLYELWSFVQSALYRQERYFLWLFLVLSIILFYSGIAFCYGVVLPLIMRFFSGLAPGFVQFMPDMSHYLQFNMQLFFAFGLAFELPIVIVLLVVAGLTTRSKLIEKRPFMVVMAFVVGMLLTPPDVLSQLMLALPICALYELGLLVCFFIDKKKPCIDSGLS